MPPSSSRLPELVGLVMDLNVPKRGFKHMWEFMSRRGSAYTAASGLLLSRCIPNREKFMDTWRVLATPLELQPPGSIPDPPTRGCSSLVQSLVKYVQSCPSLVDHIRWTRPLTVIGRRYAYTALVAVGPNSPLASSTAAYGAMHPRSCG